MDGHLQQVGVYGRGGGGGGSPAPLVARFALLLGVVRAAPPGALPQVLEGRGPEAGPELEAVGEEEELPAFLQLCLDLHTRAHTHTHIFSKCE